MVSSRRRGVETSAMRAKLIAAAEDILREEGFSALTSRTLAERVSLKRQIIHYYFGSIDELLIAVVQRSGEQNICRLEEAVQMEEPLRAVWEVCSDAKQAALMLELNALANRRPAVNAEVLRWVEAARDLQTQALVRHLEQRGLEPTIPPEAATVVLACLSQMLALEAAIGVRKGHAETMTFVDQCLAAFANDRESGPAPFMR